MLHDQALEEATSASLSRSATGENTAGRCNDGNDNDNDGAKDCADAECMSFSSCATKCNGGPPTDADGDGYAACSGLSDQDCDPDDPNVHPGKGAETASTFQPEVRCNSLDDDCNASTPDTPHFADDSVTSEGTAVASTPNLCGETNEYWLSCVPDGDRLDDFVVEFTAPSAGIYLFSTGDSSVAVGILEGTCPGGEISCEIEATRLALAANEVVYVVLEPESTAQCGTLPVSLDICRDDDEDDVCASLDLDDGDPAVCGDEDNDGCQDCANGSTPDTHNDGLDTNGDGECDLTDTDDDGDSVDDVDDDDPKNRFVCRDTDGDDCDDCSVLGRPDVQNDGLDTNGDEECDLTDTDDDGDSIDDVDDDDPKNRFVCRDTDNDGCDDCSVVGLPRPDNDGLDTNGDEECDLTDTDDDGDSVDDVDDDDPKNRFVCRDTDNDDCDDCSVLGRPDVQNDGLDTDSDTKCDLTDEDDDGDRVDDVDDDDPKNRRVCQDTDNDGCDDCSVAEEPQPNNDGIDVDQDGWCNISDCDDLDPNEFPGQRWLADCDGDGFFRSTHHVTACDPAEAQGVSTGPCPGPGIAYALSAPSPDCDDGDPIEFPGQIWYADCDNDGVVGAEVTACDIEDADALEPCEDGLTPDGGYTHTSPPKLDCDDENALRTPGRPESCEIFGLPQIDNDCNGDINTEGSPPAPPSVNAQVLFIDQDLDGFGNPDEPVDACGAVPGLSSNGSDCDDGRPDVHLGAEEICDGADQNCNGLIDEADFLAQTNSLCVDLYRDRDGDGYGDVGTTKCLCADTSLTAVYDNETYVATFSDCDDLHADIKPHECNDGKDNDRDGFVDDFDTDCKLVDIGTGLRRPTTESAPVGEPTYALEILDGHDNQCDGIIPLIELDCDDDGSFPLLPVEPPETFADATELGLARCSGGPIQFPCWGQTLTLFCDVATGLWGVRYGSSENGFDGRFSGGHRELVDVGCDSEGDCDDQCPARCPGVSEVCDGVDNNCSGVVLSEDTDGIPDSIDPAAAVGGTVSQAELDLDGDAHAACEESFRPNAAQIQAEVASCEPFVDAVALTDCDDLCYLANDQAEEACNGFVDVCGAPAADREGRDADGDGRSTCGAWSSNADTFEEQAFVPVWVDCSGEQAGCESIPSIDDGAVLSAYVPLVPPRPGSLVCDEPLREQLNALLLRTGQTLTGEETSTSLVQALCDGSTGGLCTVVKLRLVADGPGLAAAAAEAEAAGLLPEGCSAEKSEYSLRTVWNRERLLDARAGVVELECLRVFGRGCDELGSNEPALVTGAPPDIDDLLNQAEAPWFAEIARFSAETADGIVMGCWGDPRIRAISDKTGGDCNDDSRNAHRDLPEGPYDVVSIWRGEQGDCSRCLDGLDNNCDGLADCADPTCDVCFVGQGRGCAGFGDACAAAADKGCSTAPPSANLLPMMAAITLLLRRRSVLRTVPSRKESA